MALLSVQEAYGIIMSCALPHSVETVAIHEATGRILAREIFADRDYPPINRATMDGIAVSGIAARAWRLEATIPAGEPAKPLIDTAGGCAQIMTGAEVPANADAVVPFEDIDINGDIARLKNEASIMPGQHIHAKSADRRRGDRLLQPGVKLDAPRVAILAVTGHAMVPVVRLPRVGIISTGNEIVPVDAHSIQPTQVRASNQHGLISGLRQLGIHDIDVAHVADDAMAIHDAIANARRQCDVLLLSGGVSKGKFDYVPDALRSAGVEHVFHGIAQKPGKPLWFGRTSSCCVFGLPGNPVSTLTVFRRYVVPFIQCSLGMQPPEVESVSLGDGIQPHPTLTLLLPVKKAGSRVDPVTYHGSGDLAALAESDGFVEISPGSKSCLFSFYPW